MEIRDFQLTFDAVDPASQCAFWCAVLGYEIDPPPQGFDSWDAALESFGVPPGRRTDASACHDPSGVRPRLFFQRVDEPKTVKNKLHVDVRAAPGRGPEERMATLELECERLVALGATRVERQEPAPPLSQGSIVLQDPEGNELCLD